MTLFKVCGEILCFSWARSLLGYKKFRMSFLTTVSNTLLSTCVPLNFVVDFVLYIKDNAIPSTLLHLHIKSYVINIYCHRSHLKLFARCLVLCYNFNKLWCASCFHCVCVFSITHCKMSCSSAVSLLTWLFPLSFLSMKVMVTHEFPDDWPQSEPTAADVNRRITIW